MSAIPSHTARELADAYIQRSQLPPLPSGHFIDGQVCAPQSGNHMPSWDAGLGRPFADFAAGDMDDVDRAVLAANNAQSRWGPRRRPRAQTSCSGLRRVFWSNRSS